MKTLFITTSILFAAFASQAQNTTKAPVRHHIEIGLHSEVGTFINPNFYYNNKRNITFNEAIVFRYRLNKTFKINTGLAFSIEKSTFEPYQYEWVCFPQVNVNLESKYTGYLLRLPLALQTNLWHDKFYAVSGIELNMPIHTQSIDNYREIASGKEFETLTKNSSFIKEIDVQLLAALGWNFKAIKDNSFSLETTAKLSIYNSFRPAASSKFGIMPNVKLSWFFKK